MNHPTRGQWRGYTLLVVILAAILLFLIFKPVGGSSSPADDNSRLNELVSQYGDAIQEETVSRRTYSNHHSTYRKGYTFDYDTTRRTHTHAHATFVIDINSADTLQLQQLRGIGPAFARRIVKYRSLLGGFANKEQLLEVYGMTEDRYCQFASQIIVDTSLITKIPINKATVEQLRRHPYLDYYQASAIVKYCRQIGALQTPSDLLLVNLIDEETFTKILPYIQFN